MEISIFAKRNDTCGHGLHFICVTSKCSNFYGVSKILRALRLFPFRKKVACSLQHQIALILISCNIALHVRTYSTVTCICSPQQGPHLHRKLNKKRKPHRGRTKKNCLQLGALLRHISQIRKVGTRRSIRKMPPATSERPERQAFPPDPRTTRTST